MKCFRVFLLLFCSAFAISVYAANAPKTPPNARLIKETIINVFRMADNCKTVDEVQLSVQPLLFFLYRSRDRESSRVLVELTSYKLGEANGQILDCILIRRGTADKDFVALMQKESDDCRAQLGEQSQ